MKNNRYLPSLLSIFILLIMTACSAPRQTPTSSPAQPTTKQPPYTVGVSNVSVANSYRVQVIEEIKYAASKKTDLIKSLVITDAGGDANKQIADIEDLVTQKVDILLVAPASYTALSPAVEEAVNAGIPVVVFNTDLESDKVISREWAKLTTEWLVKTMNGKGDIIALRGIAGLAAEADEWAGAEEALKGYPDIKIICTEYADWAYDKAKTAVANCIANRPQIDGILSLGDAMTWAAAEVLLDQGYDVTKIPMIGIGGSNGFLKFWQTNGLNAYVIADPTDIGVTALNVALDYLQGKTVSAQVSPSLYAIDNSNLTQFVKPSLPDSAWVGTQLTEEELIKLLNK